jgi:hypothetical protein
MARPPGLVSDGVAWPEVVALQAQVKSKELWRWDHPGNILQSEMELVRYRIQMDIVGNTTWFNGDCFF